MFGLGVAEIVVIVLVAAILYFVWKASKNKTK
jgi:Sec-independent protein translocase protein TatA